MAQSYYAQLQVMGLNELTSVVCFFSQCQPSLFNKQGLTTAANSDCEQ